MEVVVENEQAMEHLGGCIADSCQNGSLIFLSGDLGAGKTTLVRGLLRRFGYQGNVKSPTYTIVETYDISNRRIYHLDLYRLHDPEELEYLGVREFSGDKVICLIEWPEQGAEVMLTPDLVVQIGYEGKGRRVKIQKKTSVGVEMVDLLSNMLPMDGVGAEKR